MKRLVAFVVVALFPIALACKKGEAHPSPAPAASPITVTGKRIDVKAGGEGFVPNAITVKKGEATTLVFTRTTDDTCATKVVFPEIKLEKELPLNQPVPIELPVDKDRTLAFQCGMGMFKSKVVVQ
ncbi:MAG: cupredoxin domain-containing protein [Polyangiales bacterium]